MFMSEEEHERRKEEMEHRRGITPETKRYMEIKAGVIMGSVGLGVAILLYVLMEGIILSGNISTAAAEILSRLWIVGVIPLFIGIALIVNGTFVSKKLVELQRQIPPNDSSNREKESEPRLLRSADTSEVIPSNFSVTEGTTKHLSSHRQKQ
jgi:hypothetical protein